MSLGDNNNVNNNKSNKPSKQTDDSSPLITHGEPMQSKRSVKKYLFILTLISVMSVFVFAKYYYCFMIFDEKFYKSNFYSWRVKYADPLMYKDTWKFIGKNKYYSSDPNNEYTRFIDRMQTKQLLFTGHPEHYPRQHKHYDSHSNHPFNDDFLSFRNTLCKLYDEPLRESIYEGKELLTDKKMLYWAGKKGEHVKNTYFKSSDRIVDFMNAFTIVLNKLYEGDYKKTGLVGKKCPEKIVDDFERMSKAAGFDLSRDYLSGLPKKFGLINSKTIENFGYSRLFYLFYFCTLDCKIDTLAGLESEISGESKKEKDARIKKLEVQKKKPNARLEVVSICFAQLMSNLFEHDFGEGRKQLGGLHSFLIRGFGVDEAKKINQDKNIKILMEELNRVVEPESK